MKITSVDVMMNGKTGDLARHVFCRVNTDEGIYGYGEGAATFISGSEGVFGMLQDFARRIIGMNPLYHEVVWSSLYNNAFWTKGNGAILYSAVSAIDMALWDIKGKAAGMPVYQLLGGKHRDKLKAYASQLQFGMSGEGITPQGAPEEYAQVCREAVELGYQAVKVDVFHFDEQGRKIPNGAMEYHISREHMRMMERRLSACRKALGPDVELIVECHCRTNTKSAIQFAKMAEAYDIYFMEEAAAPMNPQLFKQIADSTVIPQATGERSYTRFGFLPLFENGSLTVAQPDIGTCGGLTEAKKIADLAFIYDVGIQAHVCGGPIGVAASAHLEAAIPNFAIHEQHVSNLRPANLAMGVYDYHSVDGYFPIPELPGLGQELSEFALSQCHIVTVK